MSFEAVNIPANRFKIKGNLTRSASSRYAPRLKNMPTVDVPVPPDSGGTSVADSVHSDTLFMRSSLEIADPTPVVRSPVYSLLGTTYATIFKDAKAGSVIAAMGLRTILNGTKYPRYWEMLTAHTFKPRIKVRLTIPGNAFTGLALGVCMDWYGRVTNMLVPSGIPWEIMRLLPNRVFSCGVPGPHEFVFDLEKEGGHAMTIDGPLFGNAENIYVYVITSNQRVLATDHIITIETFVDIEDSPSLFIRPSFTMPMDAPNSLNTDFILGKYSISTVTRVTHVDLVPAMITTSASGASLAWWQALLRNWLGYHCKLRMRIIPTSSAMVGAVMRIYTQSGSGEVVAAHLPHIDCAMNESFVLNMRSRQWASQLLVGGQGGDCTLTLEVVGGVQVPQDTSLNYECGGR